MAQVTSPNSPLSWDEVDVTGWLNGTAEDSLMALEAIKDQHPVPSNQEGSSNSRPPPTTTTKPRRLACLPCRHRKVRCSGGVGGCQRCTRLGQECIYDKGLNSGPDPKSQPFEQMKARLDLLEKLFSQQNSRTSPTSARLAGNEETGIRVAHAKKRKENDPTPDLDLLLSTTSCVDSFYGLQNVSSSYFLGPIGERDATATECSPDFTNLGQVTPSISSNHSNPFSIQTPPVEEVASKRKVPYVTNSSNSPPLLALLQNGWHGFHQKYFELVHPSIPILDQNHFFTTIAKEPASPHSDFAALCLAVHMHGAIAVDPQSKVHVHYYQCARQLLERLETDRCKIGLAAVQAWTLISIYEFRRLLFPEAWISSGRTSRLAQMMGLHRLDFEGGQRLDMNPPLIQLGDGNQNRQTFAFVFILDRFTSMSTGLPMALSEKQITAKLASPDGSYSYGSVCSALQTGRSTQEIPEFEVLSSLGKMVFVAEICARVCGHGNTPLDQVSSSYITSHDYWFDYYHLDQVLSCLANTMSFEELPSHEDPSSQFIIASIHAAIIHLQKGAIDHGKKVASMEALVKESTKKCLHAALEIAKIVQMMKTAKSTSIHPFFPWSLYCATKVTSYFLSKEPNNLELLEKQNLLVELLTAMGGRVDRVDDSPNSPFTRVTQRAC